MKFITGFLIGLLVGMLALLSMVAAFIGGLVLGWRVFSNTEGPEDTPTATEEAQP